MLVRLIWDPKLSDGRKIEKIINAPNNCSKELIKRLFLDYIGIEFDEFCRWEILDE